MKNKLKMMRPTIEFFIDTHCKEAYDYVITLVSTLNESDTEINYSVMITNIYEESDESTYFSLKGTWEAYRNFLVPHRTNLNLPENYKYRYSLHHYEDL